MKHFNFFLFLKFITGKLITNSCCIKIKRFTNSNISIVFDVYV